MMEFAGTGKSDCYLEAKDFGLSEGERSAVYFDEALSGLEQYTLAGLSTLYCQAMEGYLAVCDSGC